MFLVKALGYPGKFIALFMLDLVLFVPKKLMEFRIWFLLS